MYTTLIDKKLLVENLDNPDWIIVDCRYDLMDNTAGQSAWLEAHIPGAVYASVSHALSSEPLPGQSRHPLPSPIRMREIFSRLGIDSSKQVVVYDANGGAFCSRLWWMLRYMEHDAVAVLDGGWQAWIADQSSPLELGEMYNRSTKFLGNERSEWLLTADQVEDAKLLIDSRDADRYAGKVEPIDPVAGHIPGAINHCWQLNVDESGHMLDAGTLAENFKKLLVNNQPEDVVFYCGSGVTACQNLLAFAHAGLGNPRLYAGSWSEWCSDPSRPVETGFAAEMGSSNPEQG